MSGALTLREIARIMGGEVTGQQVVCPGPGHRSPRDRSLSIRLSHQSPTGWITHSYANDPFDACRDFVAAKLGMPTDAWRARDRNRPQAHSSSVFKAYEPEPDPDNAARIARARGIWNGAGPAAGTLVETYLASRGLRLESLYNVQDCLRFHPACPWRDEEVDRTIYVPAMVCAMRQVQGDDVTAIHRTRLASDGTKLGRRMLGQASGVAVKLDADDTVTMGLAVGEGIETVMQGRQLGFRPGWALGSAGAIERFPVLGGVEALTLHAERDPTNARAVEACASRWHCAGREVVIIEPTRGSDINDAARGLT